MQWIILCNRYKIISLKRHYGHIVLEVSYDRNYVKSDSCNNSWLISARCCCCYYYYYYCCCCCCCCLLSISINFNVLLTVISNCKFLFIYCPSFLSFFRRFFETDFYIIDTSFFHGMKQFFFFVVKNNGQMYRRNLSFEVKVKVKTKFSR